MTLYTSLPSLHICASKFRCATLHPQLFSWHGTSTCVLVFPFIRCIRCTLWGHATDVSCIDGPQVRRHS